VTERSLRVAMIGQKGYPPVHGGIEKHVAELATRLVTRGIDVDVFSRPHYSDADGPTAIPGLRVRRLASIPTKHLDAISHSILATGACICGGYDIVHYHAIGPGMLSGFPRWLSGKKTVVTVHGLDWQREKWGRLASGVLRVGELCSARFPDRTIVVSRALAEHFRRRHDSKTVSIPNGITAPTLRRPDAMRSLGVEPPYILFVGRLVPEKGCHLLLSAYSALPAAVRDRCSLVIAGDAGFTESYARKLREDASGRVIFTGFVHGPVLDELFTNAEIVVLPSTLEGLSIALLEGMSYGRCCLVSDIPPNREAGEDCVATFPSGDEKELGRALVELLADPARRRELGEMGRRRVLSEYSWDQNADATAELYRDILNR